jgi:hypothetical protein
MIDTRPPFRTETVPIRNRRRRATTLRLEPWGHAYRLGPGETVHVHARGPDGDALEIERTDDAIVVYAWPGSIVAVHRRGREIGSPSGDERLTAPWLPRGMRTREWIVAMTG